MRPNQVETVLSAVIHALWYHMMISVMKYIYTCMYNTCVNCAPCIMAELSFKKNLCRYFEMKVDKHANASAVSEVKVLKTLKLHNMYTTCTCWKSDCLAIGCTFIVEVECEERSAERVQSCSLHNHIPSLTHTLTHSYTHSLTHTLTHSLIRSLTHTLTHSYTHSLTHTLTHSYTHSLIHSLTHSYAHSLIHSLTHTLTHSYTHSLTHTLTHSYTHSLIHSLTHSYTHSHIHSLTHTLTHSYTHSLIH